MVFGDVRILAKSPVKFVSRLIATPSAPSHDGILASTFLSSRICRKSFTVLGCEKVSAATSPSGNGRPVRN